MKYFQLLPILFLINLNISISQINTKTLIFKDVKFNNSNYRIHKPLNYNFYNNSIYKNTTISEFTKTNMLSIEVVDLELLIPDKIDSNPLIHFYSYKALENKKVSNEEFNEYKEFWKNGFNNGTYDKIAKSILSDSVIIKKHGVITSKANGYSIIEDKPNHLSALVFITGESYDKTIVVTNYIHINQTVILVRLSKNYNDYKDLKEILNDSEFIVSQFLKSNDK